MNTLHNIYKSKEGSLDYLLGCNLVLKRSLEKAADLQERYPVLWLLGVLTITLFLSYYAVRIGTDSNFDTLYREDSDTRILGRLVSDEFGQSDRLFILIEIDESINDVTAVRDIREPSVLSATEDLARSIRAESSVSDVLCIADVLRARYGRLPETLEESKEMLALLGDTSSLVSQDYRLLNMIVTVNVETQPGALENLEDAINERIINAPKINGMKTTLTGLPTLLNRIMNLLINDNISTIGIALFFVLIVLSISFRSVRIGIVSVLPVVLVLIWLAGTMSLLGIRITMMIASVGAMMVGLGVDYAIHMTHGYNHAVRRGERNPTHYTVVAVGSALFASFLTTVAGFLAMTAGGSPLSVTQGIVLALGITYAFITSILVLPAILVLQRKLVYSRLDEAIFTIRGEQKTRSNQMLKRVLTWLAVLITRRPYHVLVTVIALTVIAIPGLGLVRMDTSNDNWLPKNDPVWESLDKVGYNFGGVDSQNFLVMIDKNTESGEQAVTDLRDPRVLQSVADIDATLERLKYIDSVDSPADTIKNINEGRIPQTFEQVQRIMAEHPETKQMYNRDYSIMLVALRSNTFTDREQYYEVLGEIEGIRLPTGVTIIPQGGFAEDIELDKTINDSMMLTTLLGFALVFIIASLFFRSIVRGLLAFVPIFFAIAWTIGTMGYVNLPFTVLTTGMLAILMGAGIDYSIHIMHSTERSIKEGMKPNEALRRTITTIGESLFLSTITTMIGFLALTLASLLATKRLGLTLTLGMMFTFFSCVLIVPAILSIVYKTHKVKP